MKWFKHQSDMRNDPKIKRLIRRHGANGYAVYCYIIEAISGRLTSKKPMPDLEETLEDISYDLNIELEVVNKIINTCLEQKLLSRDSDSEIIFCYKIFKFLDDTTRKQTEVTKLLKEAEEKGYLSQGLISLFPTNKINPDEFQIDANESDKLRQTPTKSEDVGQTPTKSEDVGQTPTKSEDVGQTPTKSGKVRLEEEEEEEEEIHTTDFVPKSGKRAILKNLDENRKYWRSKAGIVFIGDKGEKFKAIWEKFTVKTERASCMDIFNLLYESPEWSEDLFKHFLNCVEFFEKQNAARTFKQKSLTFFLEKRWEDDLTEAKQETPGESKKDRIIEMPWDIRTDFKKAAVKCREGKPGCQGLGGPNGVTRLYKNENCKCGHCKVIEDLNLKPGFIMV